MGGGGWRGEVAVGRMQSHSGFLVLLKFDLRITLHLPRPESDLPLLRR